MIGRSTRFASCAVVAIALSLLCASVRADATPAHCFEASTKALALRHDQRLSAARLQLLRCADPSCPTALRNDCARRLDELEKAQPTVVLDVKNGAGEALSTVNVSLDDQPLADGITGAALPVDPGPHTFTLEVAGQAPVRQQFVMHEGEKRTMERVVIGYAAAPGAPPRAASPPMQSLADKPGQPPSAGTRDSPSDGRTQRAIGLVTGGVGAAWLVAGALFGGLSIAAHNAYEKNCGSNVALPDGQCDQQGSTVSPTPT